MLKTALPEAHELSLGFEAEQRMSPGTAKTAIEALGKSGKIRRNGRIIDLPIGRGCRKIDFGRGPKLAMPIPWGDVATPFHTTGIPNITVFTPISSSLLALPRLMNAFGFILRSRHVQTWLVERIQKTVYGPDAATRDASPTWLWGEAKDLKDDLWLAWRQRCSDHQGRSVRPAGVCRLALISCPARYMRLRLTAGI